MAGPTNSNMTTLSQMAATPASTQTVASSAPRILAPPAGDPWSTISTNADPWGAATQAGTVTPRIAQDTSYNRGKLQGQSVMDFLKGFISTYNRPHNGFVAPSTPPPAQPPATGGGTVMTGGTQPLHPIITPVTPPADPGTTDPGTTDPGTTGGTPSSDKANPGMKVNANTPTATITPTGGGPSAPPAGAPPSGSKPVGLSGFADWWVLPDGSMQQFPGYTTFVAPSTPPLHPIITPVTPPADPGTTDPGTTDPGTTGGTPSSDKANPGMKVNANTPTATITPTGGGPSAPPAGAPPSGSKPVGLSGFADWWVLPDGSMQQFPGYTG